MLLQELQADGMHVGSRDGLALTNGQWVILQLISMQHMETLQVVTDDDDGSINQGTVCGVWQGVTVQE